MSTMHITITPDERPISGPDVLIYYDGPQLFWLRTAGRRFLAVAVPAGGRWPFLVVELSDEQAQALEANQLTLQAACLAAQGRWLMPDYDAESLELQALPTIPADWLPGNVMLGPAPEAPCQ